MYRPKIYIAAPINNMSFDLALERNKKISEKIESAGFEAIDPLHPVGNKLAGEVGALDLKARSHGISSHDIVNSCLDKIGRTDGMLVYIPDFKKLNVSTWGTPMEMIYAHAHGKLVVCVINDYHSAWIDVFSKKTDNIDEAIKEFETLKQIKNEKNLLSNSFNAGGFLLNTECNVSA